LNSTWYVDAALANGCHNYWVLGRDAKGARLTYPTTGSLNVSVGGVACANGDYQASQPAAACESGLDMAVVQDLTVVQDFAAPSDLAGSCTLDAQCAAGKYCAATGYCAPKLASGSACPRAAACTSGFC